MGDLSCASCLTGDLYDVSWRRGMRREGYTRYKFKMIEVDKFANGAR